MPYVRAGMISCQIDQAGAEARVSHSRHHVQVYPNSRALVVSTENITQNWYFGNNKAMLIPNCLFRVGGAALVLTNRRSDRRRAK